MVSARIQAVLIVTIAAFTNAKEYGEPAAKKTTCPCGWTNQKTGEEVNEYPFMATVVSVNVADGNEYCGGAILTPRHVLTSAHCTYVTDDYDFLFLLVGDHHISNDDRKSNYAAHYLISKHIEHPEYNHDNSLNDIAIVVTEMPIKFNVGVGSACLPKSSLGQYLIDNSQILKSPGAGELGRLFLSPENLMTEDLKAVSSEKCGTIYSNQICISGNRTGICNIEYTIGPLFWMDPETKRYTVAAMTNKRAVEDCQKGSPFTSTEVSPYLPWIQDEINVSVPGSQLCTKED